MKGSKYFEEKPEPIPSFLRECGMKNMKNNCQGMSLIRRDLLMGQAHENCMQF